MEYSFFDFYHYGNATPAGFRTELEGPFRDVSTGNYGNRVEFLEWTRFREGNEIDEKAAKIQTWERFCKNIQHYMKDKPQETSTLVWSVLPEEHMSPSYVVVSYDDNGPDIDHMADRKCHIDKGWKRYAVYTRFAVV